MPKAEYTDTQRLDALERAARKRGGLLLHSETGPTGRLGLGIDGRTLHEAVDMVLLADGIVPASVAGMQPATPKPSTGAASGPISEAQQATPSADVQAAPKPYAYEFGRSNGDGTYSVVIERGSMVNVGLRRYEYGPPRDPHPDHPVKPLYEHPPTWGVAAVDQQVLSR